MTNPIYALILFISGLITLVIAAESWRRRPIAGAAPLGITMLMITLWDWAYAFSWLTPATSAKFFWLGVSFVGVVVSSPIFLIMAMEFTGYQERLTRWFYTAIFTLPVVGMAMYITDPWFGLFFGGVNFADPNEIMRGGLGFVLIGINGHLCTFIAIWFLVRDFFKGTGGKRSSILVILVGTFFPFAATIISILQYSPFPGLDITPLGFLFSGVLYAYGLFRYRMMDLAPVGRAAVLENMEDAMVVLDDINRVVDMNPTARSFLNTDVTNPIGQPVTKAFSSWAQDAQFTFDVQPGIYSVQVGGADSKHFDIRVTTLFNTRREVAGRLFVFQDVTTQKRSEIQLKEANTNLKRQLEEIDQLQEQLHEVAIRDSLTGLYNRHFMEQAFENELKRATDESLSFSIAMIDIDNFKMVNDTYGHSAGDEVLRRFGNMIMDNIHPWHFACRYGGDEFVILMPDTSYEDAQRQAEKLKDVFSMMTFEFDSITYQTTLSTGIASYPVHANSVSELLLAADKKLYSSKGTNR